jgi:hypothetical protein
MALLSHILRIPDLDYLPQLVVEMSDDDEPKPGTLGESRSRTAAMPRLVLAFMQHNQPKFLTQDELGVAAMRQLNVSKSSFDFAWIEAIETTGRHDWYELLRPTAARQNLVFFLSAYCQPRSARCCGVWAVTSNVAYRGKNPSPAATVQPRLA